MSNGGKKRINWSEVYVYCQKNLDKSRQCVI